MAIWIIMTSANSILLMYIIKDWKKNVWCDTICDLCWFLYRILKAIIYIYFLLMVCSSISLWLTEEQWAFSYTILQPCSTIIYQTTKKVLNIIYWRLEGQKNLKISGTVSTLHNCIKKCLSSWQLLQEFHIWLNMQASAQSWCTYSTRGLGRKNICQY